MTNEEAMNTLKVIKAILKIYPKRKKQKESVAQLDEALNMAIKALENMEYLNRQLGDGTE